MSKVKTVRKRSARDDAWLFETLKLMDERHAEWVLCRSDDDYSLFFKKWTPGHIKIQEAIAACEPVTLAGVFAKADYALRSWREDEPTVKNTRLHAVMASSLERALVVIRSEQAKKVSPV
jgi:hypothetical protein